VVESVEINCNAIQIVYGSGDPWCTPELLQMWVPKWKQWNKELGYVPLLITLRGKRGMLELQDGD
jgi:hypothetical protein